MKQPPLSKMQKTVKFKVSDETGDDLIEATSAREAAERFAESGEYGDGSEPVWVDVNVAPYEPLRVE
jgi:hypothetical protein